MNDYIDRENALDIIAHNNVNGEITLNRYDKIIDGIYEIPSADAAPVRHGHWVESFKVNAPPTLRLRWICSWCGNVQTYGATGYCPNCGAKMDEEVEA